MSIESLLKDLVSRVEGATGAIVLAADGEAVKWCATAGVLLRLRGAYVSVLLQSCRASGVLSKVGNMRSFVVEYEGASFVAQQIDDYSFIALELSASANIAEAMFRLGPAVAELCREFAL